MSAQPEPDARRRPTAREERASRLPSGAALWRLNQLGLLGEGLAAALRAGSGVRIDAGSARDVLHDAAVRGDWTPQPPRNGLHRLSGQGEALRRYEARAEAALELAGTAEQEQA